MRASLIRISSRSKAISSLARSSSAFSLMHAFGQLTGIDSYRLISSTTLIAMRLPLTTSRLTKPWSASSPTLKCVAINRTEIAISGLGAQSAVGGQRSSSNSNRTMFPDYYGMGRMSARNKAKKNLSERGIDQTVVAQASDDSTWEKPIYVRRHKATSLSLSASLAARAAFLAQVHRTKTVDAWLTHVIQERIELEEAAFVGAKQDLATKARPTL